MARATPGSRIEIDPEICAKIQKIMNSERYHGSFTSYVESVLDRFADGMLVEPPKDDGVKEVKAVRVRRISAEQARKIA